MMRGSDTVARLGGDEFAFVVESVRNDSDLIALARQILSSFEEPFVVGTRAMGITASLGIAVGSQRESADIILRNADTAMYRAKATRRGGFELFDDEMRRRVLRELEVRNKLAEAVQNHELQVYYQPIVSLANGRPLAIEALVRWLDPQWGWVPPDEFIPLAEGDGLIVQLGRSVLAETVRQTALWRNDYPHLLPLGVFVNVSPRELAEPDFIPFLVKALADEGLTPSQFGIEITERVFINERDDAIVKNVRELGAMGVRLSLDDFGTGYSALASIKRFPFTALKIDRFFIRSIRRSTDVAPISNAVVSLGKALGLTVIAEGVETSLQADYLRRLGCDAAQGYYYARPQPAEQLSAYLAAIACPPDTARLGRTPAAA
jgi:predicted signal transduction protein with EAL and GGDEF domain